MKRTRTAAGEKAMTLGKTRRFKKRRRNSFNSVQVQIEKNRLAKGDWKVTLINFARSGVTGIAASGEVFSFFNNLSRGDNAVDNFQGRQLDPHGVSLRYQIGAASGDSDNVMRVIIFQYYDSTVPVPAALLANIGTSAAPYFQWTHTNRPIRKILSDRTYQLAAISNPGMPYLIVDNVYITGKRLVPVAFNATTTAIQTGGIYCLAISDSVAINHPSFTMSGEVMYLDE